MTNTDTYSSFFTALTSYAPFSLLSLFVLGALRLAPIISLAPFFGGKTPSPIKMGMLIVMTVLFLPQIVMTSHTVTSFNTEFIFLAMKELFIGFLLALLVSIPFYIAQSAGVTIDFLRGSSAMQATDPTLQAQASDIGLLYNFVLIVIFYQIDGPIHFYSAVLDSYKLIPADGWLPLQFFTYGHPVWQIVWSCINSIMAVGIQLAAPCLLAILMTEMFLGIANRLAPQVQIAFLGMSLKSLIGLGMLCAAWFFILQQMQKQTVLWLTQLTNAVHSL